MRESEMGGVTNDALTGTPLSSPNLLELCTEAKEPPVLPG